MGAGGAAAECRSLSCYCTRLPDGNYTNPFVTNQFRVDSSSYVACKGGNATALACPTGQYFHTGRRSCQLPNTSPACLRSPSCYCIGRQDGLHLPFPADSSLGYLCISGGGLKAACPEGAFLDTETGTCGTRPHAIRVSPAVLSECRQLSCYCRNRAPGRYPNILAAKDTVHRYQEMYIQCANGTASLARCPDGQVFDTSSTGMRCFVPPAAEAALRRDALTMQRGAVTGQAGPEGV
jgi:hypothetical protein